MDEIGQDILSFAKMLLQILRRLDYICFYLFFRLTKKIDESKVLMLSDSRETLSGNLWFIEQELQKRGISSACFLKKNLKVKKSLHEKINMCRAMAESGVILLDDFYPLIYPIPLRKDTRLIQVWHAMGAFKTVGFSRMGKEGGPGRFSMTHRNYTDAIVSSEAVRKNYAEAFHMEIGNVHATGIPRTDIFFDSGYREKIREKLWDKYPLLKGKKVILFAPTFRGNGQNTAHYDYNWMDFEKIRRVFGGDYVCIVKMHPFIKNKPQNLNSDFYLDLTEEREINDLLFITDILITDYSSVIFEASLLKIDTVFYVPDLEEYIASRDFYYPFEEYTFGKTARTTEELIAALQNPETDEKQYQRFVEKFCSACDGHSAKRFVDTFWNKKTYGTK